MSAARSGALPRVLSGIQPTADSFHLGNYLGALRQWVAMQDEFEAFYFLADQHAITVAYEPEVLRRRVRTSAAQLLALGVDPERSTIFVQSALPEHSQLAWVLSCLTGYGEASRMTQFKDKSTRGELGGASVGLFTYPILQAADILLYQADRVPVGEDQRQHLELTRDLAARFNGRFGKIFTVPEAYIPKSTAKVLDLSNPEKQMSKSAASPAGLLNLLEDPASLRKKVRSAVTDSGREVLWDPAEKPGVTNLLTIGGALTEKSGQEFAEAYAGRGYGDLKKEVAEIVVDFATGVRERTEEWLAGDRVDEVLAAGAERARVVAARTLADVYERVGFVAPTRKRGMTSGPARARWFGVTIELPEPIGSELTSWRSRLGDPSASKIPPHITLLPPTALEDADLDKFTEHLAAVAAAQEPFHVRLSGSDTFRPVSPVVFVSLVEGAPGCAHVQALVRGGPVHRALPFPYHPHVTVAHDLPESQLDAALTALSTYEADFDALGFALFERDDQGYWHVGREFSFGKTE